MRRAWVPALVLAGCISSSRQSVRQRYAMSARDEKDCGQDANYAQRAHESRGVLDSSASVDVAEKLLRECLESSRRDQATEAAIPTMTREQLEALGGRFPAADRRLLEMQAEDKRRAAEGAERRPEILIPAYSAKLCRYAGWRAAVLEDARHEQRYSEEVGVSNLGRLEHDKAMLMSIDDAAARWNSAFVKTQPLPCTDQLVSRLTPCVYADAGGGVGPLWALYPERLQECTSAQLRPYLSALGQ